MSQIEHKKCFGTMLPDTLHMGDMPTLVGEKCSPSNWYHAEGPISLGILLKNPLNNGMTVESAQSSTAATSSASQRSLCGRQSELTNNYVKWFPSGVDENNEGWGCD